MFMPEVVNELLAAIAEGQSLERWCDFEGRSSLRTVQSRGLRTGFSAPPSDVRARLGSKRYAGRQFGMWTLCRPPLFARRKSERKPRTPHPPKERSPSISCASAKTSR